MSTRKIVKVGAVSYAQLVLHMLDGVHTCTELAEITGLHYATVLQYTRALHAAKAAYICAWEADSLGRPLVKVYRIGAGKDAKRGGLTHAQRQARYRAKVSHQDMIRITAA